MTTDLFNPAVWEKAWKEDEGTTSNRMKRAGVDPTRSFDSKARVFDEEVFSEGGRRRSERIIGWIEEQGVNFDGLSVLDIGAASGGFSVPFAELGAKVTAVEPNKALAELFEANRARVSAGKPEITLVNEAFEDIDIAARGWTKAFDLVFVSMCPVIDNWDSVEKLLGCAKQFCYISLMAGERQHSLLNEVKPLLTGRESHPDASDMAYLNHLLYLKGYSYQSIITREMKTAELSAEAAVNELIEQLKFGHLPEEHESRKLIQAYVSRNYPDGRVTVSQGGRFGKVLIRLQDQNMHSRK
ncbi:SAM-dependent methyltransferase [Paenibacillus sp. PK3_47]|uniref:class I SAM-dependent methyltransferase n=1 Tax=Paenibacillus sp. PK3_47 TaxID=2072642 RepID=UPI00201E51F1|nr:class I SAM-dependent methyltransferase [Paenibacillus sp. PK3_47]UQZ32640.1 SAM-dependent methyltransferase [Paenibacillus sp. PK3_47]